MTEPRKSIFGIQFYIGDLAGLVRRTKAGGLITVPSAPVLVDMKDDHAQKQALQECDLALTDSGWLVLLWLVLRRERLSRISGLKYLQALLRDADFLRLGSTFWVMPSSEDARANCRWLGQKGLRLKLEDYYIAPRYSSGPLSDVDLLQRLEARRPQFVVLNLGGGVQERLGYFLRGRLSYRPAIICTGAAIAFLSGQQANIPPWADRLFLGWLLRCFSDPRKYVPRYWHALRLAILVAQTG